MLILFLGLFVILFQSILSTFVASRAWDYRPARIFVWMSMSVIGSITASLLRERATIPSEAYAVMVLLLVSVALYSAFLLLLTSLLFMPIWWQGRLPIRWIMLPYAVSIGLLMADVLFRWNLFVGPIVLGADGLYLFEGVLPGTPIMGGLVLIAVFIPAVTLAFAFFQRTDQRPLIVILFLSMLVPQIIQAANTTSIIIGILQPIPVLLVFAYAVIWTQLLIPTKAGLDIALQSMQDAVLVMDTQGTLLYVNQSAAALGLTLTTPLIPQLHALGVSESVIDLVAHPQQHLSHTNAEPLTIATRRIACTTSPIYDRRGELRGKLLIGRDVTEVEAQDQQLKAERQRLVETITHLQHEQEARTRLSAEVQSLSLPLIPVLEGIVVLPLVGALTSERIAQMNTVLLKGIERERARHVLIDVTGVSLIDQQAVIGLLRVIDAARLLGTTCTVVGLSPEIAQSLVSTAIPLSNFQTAATLQEALRHMIRVGAMHR